MASGCQLTPSEVGLHENMPACRESRDELIARLRAGIRCLSANRHDELLYLCNNQKERAAGVPARNPPGARANGEAAGCMLLEYGSGNASRR